MHDTFSFLRLCYLLSLEAEMGLVKALGRVWVWGSLCSVRGHWSMLSRAESKSLFATTVDDLLDDEELEHDLGEMISMISLSDSLMYLELLYVWDLRPMLVKYNVCDNATRVTRLSPQNASFFTKSFFGAHVC